ncbi:ArsR/SmtB family transcription factor [Vagococcus elongatus]|uniref:Transcriptional regulator n=1 Tax=Vagococcus elongatus TaxID=180344 RepID=A0A430B1R9_9ENTE|nr:metalloregulator ArsR/SmtB family transcription factor [Vagococcus elongatus]RSU14275.1 transcriptional regulator [Vagococcus elongatus]
MSEDTIELHPTPQLIDAVSKLYKALGDPTRLKILTALTESELNVSTISEKIGLEQSAVSHQLKVLRTNHLVASRKEGKTVYYFLDDHHVMEILAQTFKHVEHSRQQLD